jgi:hypothetical protein
MDREKSFSDGRALALAAALLAITLNFLQPLAHAALLRDGAPGALWGVFCNAAAASGETHDGSGPTAAAQHECCLGLAHATAFVGPSLIFVPAEPAVFVAMASVPAEQSTAAGIRDDPNQPRGPPILV